MTDLQYARILERRNTLQRKIDSWASIQQFYMPFVTAHRRAHWPTNHSESNFVENMPLFLPASLPATVECNKKLQQHEWRLRIAQAHDALDSLRRHLLLRTHMYKYKDRFITGQYSNTRARSTIQNVELKITGDAERYRAAHAALTILAPLLDQCNWDVDLQALKQEDIRGMGNSDTTRSVGTQRISWIWTIRGVGANAEDGLQQGMYLIWKR